MTATTTRTLRIGDAVIYHGSKTVYHGLLFKVVNAVNGRHALAYYGGKHEPTLREVRTESVTFVPRRDIVYKTCPTCRNEHWYLRGKDTDCPFADAH